VARFIRKKIVAGPHVSVSSQNKKITIARSPDPTTNKGDAGSLTIVAYDTGRLSVLAGKPFAGCSKFPTCIDYNAHEIPNTAQSRQGHASSLIKHSYVRRSYSAPH
jgi:hypothetical protein